jgi:hypothetical protein
MKEITVKIESKGINDSLFCRDIENALNDYLHFDFKVTELKAAENSGILNAGVPVPQSETAVAFLHYNLWK